MDHKKNEKAAASEGTERGSELQARHELRERSDFSREAAGVVEKIDTGEGKEGAVEFSEGKVAESVREDKKKGPAGTGGAVMTADEIEAIRAKLLANLPPQAVMVKQIRRKLLGDKKKLTQDFKKLRTMGDKAAFQLNRVVAQLRKVHEYFALLAHATFDVLKQLWLKIVHGV